jgi:hypothetical protein
VDGSPVKTSAEVKAEADAKAGAGAAKKDGKPGGQAGKP